MVVAREERESKEEAGLFCWLVCVRVFERVCVEVVGKGEESPPPLVATGRRRTTLGEKQRGERDKRGEKKREREKSRVSGFGRKMKRKPSFSKINGGMNRSGFGELNHGG